MAGQSCANDDDDDTVMTKSRIISFGTNITSNSDFICARSLFFYFEQTDLDLDYPFTNLPIPHGSSCSKFACNPASLSPPYRPIN